MMQHGVTASDLRKSPRVAFGLAATTVALKARTGKLTLRDRLIFAERALDWVLDWPDALCAVRDFLALVQAQPTEAGMALADWVSRHMDDLAPQRAGEVLDGIEASRAAHDWTTRKDCGHD